jgi:hypothetical protein
MKHGVGALVLATVCQGQVLFGAWPVPGGGEHLIAGQHQLDRPPDFPCGDGAQRDVHPEEALRTECTADQGREDADLGFGDAEVGRVVSCTVSTSSSQCAIVAESSIG